MESDLGEWAIAQERQLKLVRIDENAERGLAAWSGMVERAMGEITLNIDEDSQEAGVMLVESGTEPEAP